MSERNGALKKATLRDVAELAHVSPFTVSVVLNGSKSNTRVSEATRARIQVAAHELGYRANVLARALRPRWRARSPAARSPAARALARLGGTSRWSMRRPCIRARLSYISNVRIASPYNHTTRSTNDSSGRRRNVIRYIFRHRSRPAIRSLRSAIFSLIVIVVSELRLIWIRRRENAAGWPTQLKAAGGAAAAAAAQTPTPPPARSASASSSPRLPP